MTIKNLFPQMFDEQSFVHRSPPLEITYASYQFIVFQVWICPSLLCFVTLEQEPVGITPGQLAQG